jgi:hypothetical protein
MWQLPSDAMKKISQKMSGNISMVGSTFYPRILPSDTFLIGVMSGGFSNGFHRGFFRSHPTSFSAKSLCLGTTRMMPWTKVNTTWGSQGVDREILLVVNSYYFDARFYFNVSSFVLIGFYDYFG